MPDRSSLLDKDFFQVQSSRKSKNEVSVWSRAVDFEFP